MNGFPTDSTTRIDYLEAGTGDRYTEADTSVMVIDVVRMDIIGTVDVPVIDEEGTHIAETSDVLQSRVANSGEHLREQRTLRPPQAFEKRRLPDF